MPPVQLELQETKDARFEARLLQPYTVRWLIPLLAIPITYAVLRYHLFQGVAWAHFPLFIANKAIALSAVFCIATSYLLGKIPRIGGDDPKKKITLIKFCGLAGFSLAAAHALAAMLLISPAYYPKFFGEDGRFNFVGEMSMILGVLSFWALAIAAIASVPMMYDALGPDRWRRSQRTGYLALALLGGHVLVMGISGWLDPDGWPGSLPPISMVAFIAGMAPLMVKLLRRPAASISPLKTGDLQQ